MKLHILTGAIALAFAGAVAAQGTAGSAGTSRSADRNMHKAEKERIEAAYKADKAKCDGMKGNAKDVCMKEAKGKQDVAEAELDAKDNPSERNQHKVAEAKAKADYEVAKEKCDDMKGKEKDACEHEAKAKYDHAKASIKGDKSASRGASRDAAPRSAPATSSNQKP